MKSFLDLVLSQITEEKFEIIKQIRVFDIGYRLYCHKIENMQKKQKKLANSFFFKPSV